MLQQTQVATVIDYFNRFIHRFPTVQHLAAADIEDVLKLWEGLGYYRRARQLHAAAKKVSETHAGIFPTNFEDVLALPGIGRYTAGAILSISQDQKLPVVEANTIRLYSRLIALRKPPAESASTKLLWTVAESLLPEKRCGRFNQAAMELGSLVCTPRNPDCEHCPLVEFCQAKRLGLQETIPGKVKKMVYEDRRHIAVIVAQADAYFMRVCQPGSHWEGLWDFPRYDVTEISGNEDSYVEQKFAEEFGLTINVGAPVTKLRHGVTKYRISLQAHHASVRGPMKLRERDFSSKQQGWFTINELQDLPLNTTGRKLAKLLAAPVT